MDPQSWLDHASFLTLYTPSVLIGGLFLRWNAAFASSDSQKNGEMHQADEESYTLYRDIDGRAAQTKKTRTGRCLLSLDGRGMLGLSQIAILYEISYRIMHDLRLDELPPLCNHFDMIGGSGTGGLLAILIGRLGLAIHQAEMEYLKVMSHVSSAPTNATDLDDTLKAIIKQYTGSSETLMFETGSSTSHCKTFILAATEINIRFVKLRSYESRRGCETNLPIWQVARAAIASPGLFPPIRAGPGHSETTYISSELGRSNPSNEVIQEFETEWSNHSILCFVSVGTGHPETMQLEASSMSNTTDPTLSGKRMTDSEGVAEAIAGRFKNQNNYFRLNVKQGLQRHEDKKAPTPKDIIVHTKAYLNSTWVDMSVDQLVDSLLRAVEVFPWQTTRENFEKAREQYISNAKTCIDSIAIDAIRRNVLEAVSILQLIQGADSNEEEWLELAGVVDNHATLIAREIAPKLCEPLSEDPLWPSMSKYVIELQRVHAHAKALIEPHPDQGWKTRMSESLVSKCTASLKGRFKHMQDTLSSDVYNQVADLRRQKLSTVGLRNLHTSSDSATTSAVPFAIRDHRKSISRQNTAQNDSDATPHGTPEEQISPLLLLARASKDIGGEPSSLFLLSTSPQPHEINVTFAINEASLVSEAKEAFPQVHTEAKRLVLPADLSLLSDSERIEVKPSLKMMKQNRKAIHCDIVAPSEESTKKSVEEGGNEVASATRKKPISPSLGIEINRLICLTGSVVFDRNKAAGHGGFATVYKGVWEEKYVAVKEIRRDGKTAKWETMTRRSKREMGVWATLKHPNIVPLYGYIVDEHNHFPIMISEWCENGDASEYLEDPQKRASKSRHERIKLALEVAEGVAHIHSLKLVHGDIKPHNVLITAEGVARICDFGLIRVIESQELQGLTTTTPYTGTIRYRAPEISIGRRRLKAEAAATGRPRPTYASDIYSLGCVIYEFVSSNPPYHDCDDITLITLAVFQGDPPAKRPIDTKGHLTYFWDLLQDCWNSNPEQRPFADAVVKRLKTLNRLFNNTADQIQVQRLYDDLGTPPIAVIGESSPDIVKPMYQRRSTDLTGEVDIHLGPPTAVGSFSDLHLGFRKSQEILPINYSASPDMIAEEEREKLLSWSSSLQPQRRHEDVKAKRSKGTGGWFLNSTIFRRWSALDDIQISHVLLSIGAPGAGKTVLCSSVIKYFCDAIGGVKIAVIYFYCDYRDRKNQSTVDILGSFAKQLVSQAHSIPATVWEIFKQKEARQDVINLEDAEKIITLIIPCFDRVCVCIDALDECQLEPRRQILDFFRRLTGTTLRLFLTGRPSVEYEVVGALNDLPISKILIVANEEDIRLYLSEKFSQDPYPEAMDDSLRTEIANEIVSQSQGIFLLSMLQADAVLEHSTKRKRREALSRIPVKLPAIYNATLERIKQQNETASEIAFLILTWVYYAERQLQVEELRHALAIKDGDTTFNPDGMPSEKALVDCCLGLVLIERETSTVRLTHFTLQEYFDNHKEVLLPLGHKVIAKTCLTYLSFDHTGHFPWSLKESSQFMEYVGPNVGHHLRKGSDGETDRQIIDLLSNKDKLQILELFLGFDRIDGRSAILPLHWVAFFGIASTAKLLLKETNPKNSPDIKKATFWATTISSIRRPSSPPTFIFNRRDNYGRTPLSYAAANGHDAVVRLLINTPGIDLSIRDYDGRTSLSYAAANGHNAVVRLLVNVSTDLSRSDDYGQTPLSWAAQNGHDAVVRLLIGAPGVDINSRDKYGQTPLSWAAEKGRDAIVRLLIGSPGIDLNARNDYGQTALSFAAGNGHGVVVRLLTGAPGVDLNLRAGYGRSALSCAAINAHDAVVRLLIDTPGIELNTGDEDGRTALSCAARNGHDAVVRLLINTPGTDLNFRDKYGQTPLFLAAEMGRDAVVQLLINAPGIDLNIRTNYGRTALSCAAEKGHNAVVRLLIGTPGIDLNSRDKYGQTPLSLAAEEGRDAVVQLLLNASGIELNIGTDYGRTALSFAAGNGHDAVVELLIGAPGINLNPTDSHGETPISWAKKQHHDVIVQLLRSVIRG